MLIAFWSTSEYPMIAVSEDLKILDGEVRSEKWEVGVEVVEDACRPKSLRCVFWWGSDAAG